MSGELARKLADWIALGRRLLAASPAKWEEIMRHVGGIVEGQEVLAEADRLLILRGKRPDKRYLS